MSSQVVFYSFINNYCYDNFFTHSVIHGVGGWEVGREGEGGEGRERGEGREGSRGSVTDT